MSKIALILEAHPRRLTESHPSYLPTGLWRVVSDCASKLQVRRRSPSSETVHALGEQISGECQVVVTMIELNTNDAHISVFAEKL